MSPETHRKTTGQWSRLCSSCKVVWENLRPGWEVFSREMEGVRDRKRSETIFNNVLFILSSERMRRRRGGAEKDAKRNGRKKKVTNEEIQLKETYRDSVQDTVQHLLSNY